MEGWGKVKQAAIYAGVRERTFRKWLTQGLKFSRLSSGTVLVKFSDIDGWLAKFTVTENKADQIVKEVIGEYQ
jgi:hypothetical protein